MCVQLQAIDVGILSTVVVVYKQANVCYMCKAHAPYPPMQSIHISQG